MSTSPARRRALLAYLELLRDRMRLQAWDLSVGKGPAKDENSVLSVVPHQARHSARINVGSFFGESRGEQRYAAVHELVHLIQAPLFEWVDEGTAEQALRPAGLEWILERVKHELEVEADELARLIAPRMPLPPTWPR